ncbi:MAG: SLC13 family permease [Vulcanimicrobiaceae bacterium]
MVLVAVRPAKIPEWTWPLAGAALVIAIGKEAPQAAADAIAAQWNVLLFILGLMAISAAAERSGLFAWLAGILLMRAGGSRRRLFTLIFGAGALLTTVMSNDATAIVFTPVVYRAIASRGIDALPYLYACTFVADAASFGLPFSNPANLLVFARPNLAAFAVHLLVPMLLAVALNLGIFLALFRSHLNDRYSAAPAPPLEPRMRWTMATMVLVACAYVAALVFDVPLGPVAVVGAILVIAVSHVRPQEAAREIGWSTFALLAGMFVLLDAVVRQGAVALALDALRDEAHHGALATIVAAAFGSAIASNVLNNLPVAVISGAVVHHGIGAPAAYALVAGVDLGPNLTTTGSLATILWLSIVRARGIAVNPFEYLKLGLLVVPATLMVTSVWLWIIR